MYMTDVAILIATILGFMFPHYLIKAIRSNDEKISEDSKVISCVLFGIIIFIVQAVCRK